jgi:GAF domain-containing protein
LKQVQAVKELGLDESNTRRFDDVVKNIAQAFNVPIALVSFASETSSNEGDKPEESHTGAHPVSHQDSLDAHVISSNQVLACADVTKDSRFDDDPRVLEKGIRFYAGAPLRTSAGQVVGCLSLIDTSPRQFEEGDELRLQQAADQLMIGVEADQRA